MSRNVQDSIRSNPCDPCPKKCWSSTSRKKLHHPEISLILHRCDDRAVFLEERVHLAPHAEPARQIDSRLDRETNPRDQAAFLACLEVIEMRTGAVKIVRVDRVAGAMDEVLPITA